MMKSLRRIATGLVVAVALVVVLTAALFLIPPVMAAFIGIAGAGALMAAKYVHNNWLVGIGGLLAFSGVLAYALRVPPG